MSAPDLSRLDWCMKHGYETERCDCPAWLIVMGCMDMLIEQRLEADPAFGAELVGRMRRDDMRGL